MHTVLIADDNKIWAESLGTILDQQDGYRVVGVVPNGQEALDLIERERPDILILDIVMPEYDGTYITHHVRTEMEGYRPVIYILSGIGTDSIIQILSELDIDFYSMKPVTVSIVLENLRKLTGPEQGATTRATMQTTQQGKLVSGGNNIKDVAIQLGLSPDRPSTQCAIAALMYCLKNKDYYGLLTKAVYPDIAKAYEMSAAAVERNIRSAIAQVQRKNTRLYQSIFSHIAGTKITNSEFLSLVADYITSTGIQIE